MPSRKILVSAACAASASLAALPATAAAEPTGDAFAIHSSAKPTITLSGSTSLYPLAVLLAKGYLKSKGKVAKFKILQGGSDVGISDVSRGRVSIGMSSRDFKPSDPGGITFEKVARDPLCLVTNTANPVPNLSLEQVQTVFTGRENDWDKVDGAKQSSTIQLVVRTPASGTQDAFQSIFLGPNNRVAAGATQRGTSGQMKQTVDREKDAIGYLSHEFVSGIHAVRYRGVACNLRTAKSGQYGGTRSFWYVFRGTPGGASKKWLNWIQNSAAARRIVSTKWVPIK